MKSPAVIKHEKHCPGCTGNLDLLYKDVPKAYLDSIKNDHVALEELKLLYDPLYWASKFLYVDKGGYKPRRSNANTYHAIKEAKEPIVDDYGDLWDDFALDIEANPEYPYQERFIYCTYPRLCLRAGRRVGKTNAVVPKILHRMFTREGYRVVLLTKGLPQIETVMDPEKGILPEMIRGSKELMSSKVKLVMHPTPRFPLKNGSYLEAYVSGHSLRSAGCDLLWIDEADFLKEESYAAVNGLLAESPDIEIILTSNTKGPQTWFKDRCQDAHYKRFFFPCLFNPKWGIPNPETGRTMEDDLRDQMQTEADYNREVLALFDTGGTGVYQQKHIKQAFTDEYTLDSFKYDPSWVYITGVDWNSPKFGTRIITIGTPNLKDHYVVDYDVVGAKNWHQTSAIQLIFQNNRKWKPRGIYVDEGYGEVQIENMEQISMIAKNHDDKRIVDIIHPVQFGSTINVIDPFTGVAKPKPIKGFIVGNSVRYFERNELVIPEELKKLRQQIESFSKLGETDSGIIKYGPPKGYEDTIGDHDLIAFILCLFGFTMEFSPLIRNNNIIPGAVVAAGVNKQGLVRPKPKVPSRSIDAKKRQEEEPSVAEQLASVLQTAHTNSAVFKLRPDVNRPFRRSF